MDWQAWATMGVVALVVATLAFTRAAPDVVMVGAVTLLLTVGVLTPAEALGGLANEGMVTVAALFVVAAGIRETGALEAIAHRALGRPRSVSEAQLRLSLPVASMSAFLNNTPIVAMMVPVVAEWARKHRISPSKLMMPLSFATILGGLCTLVGTSTNVVVHGLLRAEGLPGMGMFEITWIGVPAAIVGIAYLVVASRWLLPERRPATAELGDPRAYTVEMVVEPGSLLVGQTIEHAGLRHLSGMYLLEIERDDTLLTAVGPDTRLEADDHLVFVGVVDSVVELRRVRGLKPATDQVFKLDAPRLDRCLIEAVVSESCPLLGKSIREGRFRSVYNAAVIAVSRHGERIAKKIGDIVLRPGDTLLLEGRPSFVDQQRNSRDFYLVSQVRGWSPPRYERGGTALAVLAAMVLAMGTEWITPLNAALLAAGLMVLTRACSVVAARRSVDWAVLLVIAASFALGQAMDKTGAAEAVARTLIGFAGTNPYLVLAAVYAVTMLFTELMSNNAAAVLIFPIAIATAHALDVNYRPFVMAATVAASCGFATPIGYQTNLMVYGPGGYRFGDYVRYGGLLNLLVAVIVVLLAPRVWPF